MKNNKGITLIALVITIIVMLILVAVTITIAVNGGLFNYAREAGIKTNEAKDLEQEYANLGNYEDYGFSADYEYLIDKYAKIKKVKVDFDGLEKYITVQEGMTWEDWLKKDEYVESLSKIFNNYYEFERPSGYRNCKISANNGQHEDAEENAIIITAIINSNRVLCGGLYSSSNIWEEPVLKNEVIDTKHTYYFYEI